MTSPKTGEDVASQLEHEFKPHIADGVKITVDRDLLKFTDSSGGTLEIGVFNAGSNVDDDFEIFSKWINFKMRENDRYELEIMKSSYVSIVDTWDGTAPTIWGFYVYDTHLGYYDVNTVLRHIGGVKSDYPWMENFFKF